LAGVPIFRSRVSAIRYLVRAFGFGCRFRKSAICHRLSHLLRWRVAAPGGRWQALSIRPSIQPSRQSSTQSSNFASVIRHLPSIQPSIQHRYVVTRSRPYPARRSREVEAVSGWRLGTQPRQTRAARSAAPTPRHALPLYSILHTPYSRHSHPLTANRQNLLGFLVFLKYAPPCPAPRPARLAHSLRG
jgi:hypothetical protein